jgi:hypothetical protein
MRRGKAQCRCRMKDDDERPGSTITCFRIVLAARGQCVHRRGELCPRQAAVRRKLLFWMLQVHHIQLKKDRHLIS